MLRYSFMSTLSRCGIKSIDALQRGVTCWLPDDEFITKYAV